MATPNSADSIYEQEKQTYRRIRAMRAMPGCFLSFYGILNQLLHFLTIFYVVKTEGRAAKRFFTAEYLSQYILCHS